MSLHEQVHPTRKLTTRSLFRTCSYHLSAKGIKWWLLTWSALICTKLLFKSKDEPPACVRAAFARVTLTLAHLLTMIWLNHQCVDLFLKDVPAVLAAWQKNKRSACRPISRTSKVIVRQRNIDNKHTRRQAPAKILPRRYADLDLTRYPADLRWDPRLARVDFKRTHKHASTISELSSA